MTLNKSVLIKFQNDHIFQHNGFINVDKKHLDTFLSKKCGYGDDFLVFPCSQYKVHQVAAFYTAVFTRYAETSVLKNRSANMKM